MAVIKERKLSGFTDKNVREYELAHAEVSRRAAAEGMVMLKNTGLMPLAKGKTIALYGRGASRTIKGGTGSGEVNNRGDVSVYQGLKNAGFVIANEDYIAEYDRIFDKAQTAWHEFMRSKYRESNDGIKFFEKVYVKNPFVAPEEPEVEKYDTDTAIYVLSRVAGEGNDRDPGKGDYCLSDKEAADLAEICRLYEHVAVILNVGGCVDLSFMDAYGNIDALLLMGQAGAEGGNALADIISGEVCPSGKLSDSWAYRYEDYPCADSFSRLGDVDRQEYKEGIYVGYRWFDSFGIPVRYGFGYGLSYTRFDIKPIGFEYADGGITVSVEVENTGSVRGREVVQLYVSCPEGRLDKEYRRLVAFEKTPALSAGEKCIVTLNVPVCALASYDEALPGWVLEKGTYSFWCGSSLESSAVFASAKLDREVVKEKTRHVMLPEKEVQEIKPAVIKAVPDTYSFVIELPADEIVCRTVEYGKADTRGDEAEEIASQLSTEQMISLVCGDPSKGHGSREMTDDIYVPGAAAETSSAALGEGVVPISLADGPAGLRLAKHYDVEDGKIVPVGLVASLEGGAFCEESEQRGVRYYQNCTAFPVGTLLAQTWNREVVNEVGRAVAEELDLFGVTLWLAPGMNIHRNPLCGRNFEYYSEDPVLSGCIASAMTKGVQSMRGCGVTIKHFACNSAEDNRMHSDSVLSERCLREIYLKGFEIAVKTARPMAIMSSYNKINGVHAANCAELCTAVARDEWGFDGVIMTDWTTTTQGPDCTATGCILAGNDLIMPGDRMDIEGLRASVDSGKLSLEQLRACAARVIRTALKSARYA